MEFVRGVVRSFSTQILNLEDKSAESYFRSHWTYQISVALMRGTAAIMHHVPRGASVPAHSRQPLLLCDIYYTKLKTHNTLLHALSAPTVLPKWAYCWAISPLLGMVPS